jgi:hypothetical protein
MKEMTPHERLMTALRGGVPDRVPCNLAITRWIRYHYGCTCPRHQLKIAMDLGLDLIIQFGSYVWQSVSNDYIYAPGGGHAHSADGAYGDLSDVDVMTRVENHIKDVLYHRTFETPAGKLSDVIQWSRPNMGFGDGPNPHRVEPLVKSLDDLPALRYLYPPPRRDLLADIPLAIEDIGDRAVVAAYDCIHVGGWGVESLGPENMLIASLGDAKLLKGVCRISQDAHLRNLRAMLEQGLKVVVDSWFQCGPSVGWSPATFEQVFLPLIQESVALAHEFDALYVYQDDGRMRDIIPHLVEAGVDALSGLQPPPVGDVVLRETKENWGSRVALVGGLDPCYSFDRGSPEAVQTAVRQAIADAAAGGGYVLTTAEAVDPVTTVECLSAAVQAAKDYGRYLDRQQN